MTLRYDVDAVVLDIEGTTSATGFVVDVLYPYSRSRFAALLTERADDPAVSRAIAQVRELTGTPDADAVQIEKTLGTWLDEDRKATPLKTLQGIIWSEGFARGDLVSHFYDDVVPALRTWHTAGLRLYVYSSGSVAAQRAWFTSSPEGDLLPLSPVSTTRRTPVPSRSRSRTAVSRRRPASSRPGCSSSPTGPANWTRPWPRAGTPWVYGGRESRTSSRASATTRRRGRSTRSASPVQGAPRDHRAHRTRP